MHQDEELVGVRGALGRGGDVDDGAARLIRLNRTVALYKLAFGTDPLTPWPLQSGAAPPPAMRT